MNRQDKAIFKTSPRGELFVEPLPGRFERELQEIDDLVGRAAAGMHVPSGLAERIFQASVDRLIGSPRSLPLEPVARWRFRAAGLSRLALAASLALAFIIAAQFVQTPGRPITNVVMASDTSSDVEWLLVDRPENWSSEGSRSLIEFESDPNAVESILETRDLSFDELSRDLSNLLGTQKSSS
jgi:hypothetical protein